MRWSSNSAARTVARMRPLLGTFVEIRATGRAACALPGVAAAFAAIERVHKLMSFHDDDSDVARINAADCDREVAVHADTYRVLQFAQQLRRQSAGAFDIAIAPTLVRRGLLPRPGRCGAPARGRGDLELLAHERARWRRKGWIDLGGVAKGY